MGCDRDIACATQWFQRSIQQNDGEDSKLAKKMFDNMSKEFGDEAKAASAPESMERMDKELRKEKKEREARRIARDTHRAEEKEERRRAKGAKVKALEAATAEAERLGVGNPHICHVR